MAASSDLSAWRNFRSSRAAAGPIRRPRKYPELDVTLLKDYTLWQHQSDAVEPIAIARE